MVAGAKAMRRIERNILDLFHLEMGLLKIGHKSVKERKTKLLSRDVFGLVMFEVPLRAPVGDGK